jgi:hypothetical protein
VLLPSSPVDLRLRQTQYVAVQGQPQDIGAWQPVSDLLSRARLDLKAGRLEMPSQQRFPIPRALLSPAAQADDQPPTTTTKTTTTTTSVEGDVSPRHHGGLESVNYAFAGLELHRAVSLPYHGFTLTYTSVEAGQGGGTRAELSLQPTSTAAAPEGEPALHDDYLRACYGFARSASLWAGHVADEKTGRRT